MNHTDDPDLERLWAMIQEETDKPRNWAEGEKVAQFLEGPKSSTYNPAYAKPGLHGKMRMYRNENDLELTDEYKDAIKQGGVKGPNWTIGRAVKWPSMQRAYGDRIMKIPFGNRLTDSSYHAEYTPADRQENKYVGVNKNLSIEQLLQAIVHEVGAHSIQDLEGWPMSAVADLRRAGKAENKTWREIYDEADSEEEARALERMFKLKVPTGANPFDYYGPNRVRPAGREGTRLPVPRTSDTMEQLYEMVNQEKQKLKGKY